MKQNKVDRVETVTQKFLGIHMWLKRAETLMLLGLQDKTDEALAEVIHGIHQLKEINREEVK